MSTGAHDTIYALSSGHGRCGVAVIRVSGPAAANVLERMAGRRVPPRTATLATLRHPISREELDRALLLWFAAPASFTGEDCAEFQVHGGRAVISAVLGAIAAVDGTRPADAGEFTLRAFQNGRLDLTAAEGLADLIDAETEVQRKLALRQAGGGLRKTYDEWRRHLITAQAAIEAELDFSDEDDVPDDVARNVWSDIASLRGELYRAVSAGRSGEIAREGYRVVLAGATNVGKSSLLNALARRDAAIVSDQAGTTRDVVEIKLDLAGLPVHIADTAGLRTTQSAIEREGIRRTRERTRQADLVIWVTSPDIPDCTETLDQDLADGTAQLKVCNKADLITGSAGDDNSTTIAVSARTGFGMDRLIEHMARLAKTHIDGAEHALITRARHRHNLKAAHSALDEFLASEPRDLELRAEELRAASHAIGRITGRVDVEDVLGEIFSSFCIGK